MTNLCSNLIGRLIVDYYFDYPHGRTALMENYIDYISIAEILPSKYDGIQFPGFDSINVTFAQLKTIINADNREWRTALQSIYGIYLIVDQLTGKQYVGLNELLEGKPDDYAEKNYKFSLLEFFQPRYRPIMSFRERTSGKKF